MPDYKTMYFTLFNAITDAMQAIYDAKSVGEAMKILSDAQIKTEEIYIDTYEEILKQEEKMQNAKCKIEEGNPTGFLFYADF